jgi:hypothetical protein
MKITPLDRRISTDRRTSPVRTLADLTSCIQTHIERSIEPLGPIWETPVQFDPVKRTITASWKSKMSYDQRRKEVFLSVGQKDPIQCFDSNCYVEPKLRTDVFLTLAQSDSGRTETYQQQLLLVDWGQILCFKWY